MKRIASASLDCYNKSVVQRIIDKYDMTPMEAVRTFLTSETHRMLEDAELAMWEFSHPAILSMWECEQATGDPRNSVYIRGE